MTTQKQQPPCYTAVEVHPQSALLTAAKHHLGDFINLTALFSKTSLIGIAFAVPLLSFTPIADASYCHTVAQDWDGSVDVRSQPRRNVFNLITTIPNGTHLHVIGRSDNWLQVYTLDHRFGAYYQTGWVRERATRRICSRDDNPWHSSPSSLPLPPLPPLSPSSPNWEYDYDY